MALYPINGNDTVKPLSNATIHIETAIANKRDVDAGVTLYIPSGYQRTAINVEFNNGAVINDGEAFVL